MKVTKRKPDWLPLIFEKMGENPDNPNYLKPSCDDVWGFVTKIGQWMFNPNKKGIPD